MLSDLQQEILTLKRETDAAIVVQLPGTGNFEIADVTGGFLCTECGRDQAQPADRCHVRRRLYGRHGKNSRRKKVAGKPGRNLPDGGSRFRRSGCLPTSNT